MKSEIHQHGSFQILRFDQDRLNVKIAPELKAQLLMMITDEETENVLIDLSIVQYIDSSGLGALLLGLRQARDNGKKFALFGAQKRVLNLIHIAHLNDTLVNYENEAMAVQQLSAAD